MATGQATNSDQDAVHDMLVAMMPQFETWGRDIKVTFYKATGSDETAQRADAVAVAALKPFAVITADLAGSPVLASELAKKKFQVYDSGTSANPDSAATAGYLWGLGDPNAALINTAEMVGKQLVGKKAEFGGDDVKGQTRKFGLVTSEGNVDPAYFTDQLAKYKGTVTTASTYKGNGSAIGDATTAQAAAPTIVSKMKSDGVTTVVLLADVAMYKALMEAATAQNWTPEWVGTGSNYSDYQTFLATYPTDQLEHYFGLTGLPIYLTPPTDAESATKGVAGSTLDWFWGPTQGTASARIANSLPWLMQGIHAAGPDLTPATFKQGQFSIPARGGSASNSPLGSVNGFGRTVGLPYDEYNRGALDFAVAWAAPDIAGASATGQVGKPSLQFVNNAQRYNGGTWPTKKIAFFDPSSSISSFSTYPAGVKPPVRAACNGCPSSGASAPKPGAPSDTEIVVAVASPASS